MDELDLYDDLDEFQEQQEKKSKEIKEVEEKYQQSLKTIEVLQEENKNLKKNIQRIELGFQSLLDTARAEINRKNKEIERLRKEKDDICFRRKIPQNVASESEKQQLVHNPFRLNTMPDNENLLTKINSKTTESHTDKEEKPESNKRNRHLDEEERSNSTDYKRHRIARDEQNDKYQHSSHKIDKSCSKIDDNHRGYRENDKDSMYRKDHNRNHSRGRKDYDKSNSRNPHRDFCKSSESPERYKKRSDRSRSTERKIFYNKQKVTDRCHSREGKNSTIFTRTSSKSPTPKIKPNKDTNCDNYYHERSSRKNENEKSHKTVDDLGELKSKVFEGAKKPITTKNSQREICNMPNSKHNLEPITPWDQKISQKSTIVHIKDQKKIQSFKELTKESETKQNLNQSSIPKTSEMGTPRKVALYNEIFGKSPSESSTTASSNILLNSIKRILDKTSQIEVISSATTSPGDYTDISSSTSTPLRNATKIISSIKTSSESIMEVNKDKSMTKKSLGDTSEIDSCFIPTQQNLEHNIKSVAYIDLTEVVNDDIASELEYVQIPGLDLCFRDIDSTIKNKTITMADIEENVKLNEGQIAKQNTDSSSKTNKLATCGKEWTQQSNNECKTKSNKFLATFHSISDNEVEKELTISTEKELLNKVSNAIRTEVPTTDALIISPLKQNPNISEISSHENSEKLENITNNLATEVVVIETLKSTIIDVDLNRNDKHCLDRDEYKTTNSVESFLDHNEESETENNNRKMTEDNENVGFDESMHTKSLTDETRSLDRSKCETAAIKIPLIVSSIASSLPEKSICHSVAFNNFDVSVKSLELDSNSEEQTEPLSSTQDNSKVVQSEKQNLLLSACILNTVDYEARVIDKSQFTDKNLLVKSHIEEKFVEKEVLESEKLNDPGEFAKVVDVEVLESKTENESSTQSHLSETLPSTISTFKFLDCATQSDTQNVREIEVEKEKQSDTIVSCNLSKSESVEVIQSKELNMSEHCKKNYDFKAIEKEKTNVKIPVNLLPEELIINTENVCENEIYDKVVSTKTQSHFEDNLGDNEAVENVRQFVSGATTELSRQEVVQRIKENIFSSIEQENSTDFTEISTKTVRANDRDKNVAEITNPDISEKLFDNTESSADTKSSIEEPSLERESNIDCTLDEAKVKASQKPVENKIYTLNIYENCQENTQHLSSIKDKCTTPFTPEKLLTSIKGFENETSTKELIHEKSNERKVITDDLSFNDKEYANNSNNESKLISSVSSKNIELILDLCDSTANKVESLQKSVSSTLEEKINSHQKDETKTKPAILDSHILSVEQIRSGKNCEETKTEIKDMENILDKKVANFKNETSLHTNIESSTVNIEELHAKQQERNNKTVTPIADTSVETTAIPDAINSNEKQKSLTPKIANEQAALELHKICENLVTSSRNDETIVSSADNSNHKQESLSTETSLEIKTIQLSLNNDESPVKLSNSITVFGTNQEDKAELGFIDLEESEIKERKSYSKTHGNSEKQENIKHTESDHFNKTKDSQIIFIANEGDESSNVCESKDMEHYPSTQETLILSTNESGNSIETKTKTNLKNKGETLEAVSEENDVNDLIPTELKIDNKLNNSEVKTGNNTTKHSKNDILSFVLESAEEKAHVGAIIDQTPNDTSLYQSVEINQDLEYLEKDESDNDKKENKSKQGSENHSTSMPETSTDIRISNKPEVAISSQYSVISIQQTSADSIKKKDEQTLKLKESLQTQQLMLCHNIESEIKDNESRCDLTTSTKNNDILAKLTAKLSNNKNARVQEVSITSMNLTEQLSNNVKESPNSQVSENLKEETSKVLQQDIDNDSIRSSEIVYNDDDLKIDNSKNKLGNFLLNPSLPIGSKVASLQDNSNRREESVTTDTSLEIKTIQLSLNNAESPVKLSSSITVFGTNQEDKAELEFIDLEESEINERESYNRTHGNSEKQENLQHTDSDHFNKTKDSQTVFIVNEDDASSNVYKSKDLEHSLNKLQNLKKSVYQETLKLSTHKTGNSVETKTKTNLKNDVETKPVSTLEAVTDENDVSDLIQTEFNIENKLNNSEVETGNNSTKASKSDILSFVLESAVEKAHVGAIKDQTPNDTSFYQSVEINQDLEYLEKDESDNDKKENKSKQGSENHSTSMPETSTDIRISNKPEVAISSQYSVISIQQTSADSIKKKDEQTLKLKESLQTQQLMLCHNIESEIKDNESRCDLTTSTKNNDILAKLTAKLTNNKNARVQEVSITSMNLTEQLPNNVTEGPDSQVSENLKEETSKVLQQDIDNDSIRSSEIVYNDDDLKIDNSKNKLGNFLSNPSLPIGSKVASLQDNSNRREESVTTDTSLEIKTIQLSLNNAESPVKLSSSITVFGTNHEDKAELEFINLEESEIKDRESYNRTHGNSEKQENVQHTDSDHFNKTKDSQTVFIGNEDDASSNVIKSKDLEHSLNKLQNLKKSVYQETLKLSTHKTENSVETKTKTNLKNDDVETKPVSTLEAVTDENDVSDLIQTEFNIENKLNNSEVETGNNSTKASKSDILSFVLESAVEKAHVLIKDQTPNDTSLYQSEEINEDLEHLEKDESDNDKKENKSKQGSENHLTSYPETSTDIQVRIQQTSVESTKEKDEQTLKLKESLQTQQLMLSHNIESEIKDNESRCDLTTSTKKNDTLVKLTAQLSNNKNERVQEVSGTSIKLTEQLPNNVTEGPDSHVSESLNEETSNVLQQDIDNDTIRSSEIIYNDDDLKINYSNSKILAVKTSNRPQETESDIKSIIVSRESAKNKTICDLFKDQEERIIHSSLQVAANTIERPLQIETLTLNCGTKTEDILNQTKAINANEIQRLDHKNLFNVTYINESPCLEKSTYITDEVKSIDSAFKEHFSDTSLLNNNCVFNEKQTKSQTVQIKNAETNSHEISKVCKIIPPLVYWNINKVGMEAQEKDFHQDRINRPINITQKCKQIRTKEINIEGKIIEVVKILADESHDINKTIDMPKQTTDNLTRTKSFINEIEQQTQNSATKSNNLNIGTCDYNFHGIPVTKSTIPNEYSKVEEIESKTSRKEIEEIQYQTLKKVQSSSVDLQIKDIPFPSKEELPTVSTMLPETFGTHPILPSISTTSPTPSNFSGIFSKKSSSSLITEDDSNKPKKKSPHFSGKPKEYILPAASVLCNVDNLEYATKINKKLHWELLENKNEMTEIEDDVDIDTTDEEQLKIKEEPLENASSSPKQTSLQTKLVNRMSQKSSPSETDTQTEDESLLRNLKQQKEKLKRIKLSKVHKTKQRKNTKLPKTVRARLQAIGMSNVDTSVDSSGLIKQKSVSINLPKRQVGRPRKAENRGAFAEHHKKRGRKPKPKENKSQQEIARNTTFRCKLVNCKESKIVENKSLDGIDVINNLENSVKILSTSVERLEICDEPCTSRESVKQNKSFEKPFKDNTNKDIYNALLIYSKEDSFTDNVNKSIIEKSSTICCNNLQENNFCDFTDKGNTSTETVSLIKLPKVSKTSKESEESKMIEINNSEKANVHTPKEDPLSSRETQKNRLVHKSDRETDKVLSEKKSFKTKSSGSEDTQDNRLSNKSDTETDDGLTMDHDEDLKIKKTLKTKSILKPIIKKKFKSKSHKNRVTNFISLEDIGIKVRPLKGHLSSFRIPKIKKDGEEKIDKSWKLETYIELENEGISKELKEQSEHKRESPKILHDNTSTDTSIKDRRLNIKKHVEEIVDNSLKLKASTEFEDGSVQNHIDNGKEGSKEQNRTDCIQGKQLRDNSSKEQVTGRHMKLVDKELKKVEEHHNTNPKQSKNEEQILFDNKTKTGKRKLFSTEMYDVRDAEDQIEVAAENKHTEVINKQHLNLSKTDEPNSVRFRKSLHLPSHIANKESSERSFSNKSIKPRRKLIVHRRIFDSSSDEDNDKQTTSDKPMLNEFTKNTPTFKSSANLDTSFKEHPVSSALNRKESKKSIGVRRKSMYVEKSTLKEVENNKINESSAANSMQPLEQQSNIENSELNENKVKQSYTKNSTVLSVEAEQNKTDTVNKNICDLKLAANQNSCINNKKLSENSKKDNNMQQLPTKAIKSDKLRRKSMYVESKALKLSSPELEKVTKKPITHANMEHWNCKDMKTLDLDQDVYKNRDKNLESPAPLIYTSDQTKPKASLKIRRKSMYVEKTSLYIEEDKKDTKDLLERETGSTYKDSIQEIISVQQHTFKMQRKSTTQQDKSVSKHVEETADDSIKVPIKAKKHLISEKKVENNIGNSKNTDKGSDSVVKLTQQTSIKMRRKSTNQQKKFDTCNSLNNQVVNKDCDEFNKFSQKVEHNTKELVLNVDNNQKMEPEFDASVAVKQNESIKINRKCTNQRKIYDPEIPDQILSNTGEVKKDSDTKELNNKSDKISTHTDKGPVSAPSAVASKEKSIKMRRKSTTHRQITNSIIIKQDHEVHSDIVNKSEQQPFEKLRNKGHSPQMISTCDSSPVLIQAKKYHRKSTSYHEDSSNVLKENPENHKAADSEVSISLTQQNQEMKKNADQLIISKEKSKVLLNQDTGNTTESLNAFREKIQETHEEETLKLNGGQDKDCDSNTSVVLKQQKSFEIRRKSTNQRRILDSSSDDEPLIKKPTLTPIEVKTALTTSAKRKQRKRRIVKVLSTSMESPADITNTSQQFDCQPSFTSPTLNHPIFNTEVSTQSSEFVASLPVTPNQQDDNKFKEIDSKLHEIFQSPQYAVDYKTSPTVAATNLINLPPPLNDANITIDETHDLNEEHDQSCLSVSQINESTATLNETTAIHNKSEVKHLSLGSAEYRFEKVSDNVINLFISRKRKRKRNN